MIVGMNPFTITAQSRDAPPGFCCGPLAVKARSFDAGDTP